MATPKKGKAGEVVQRPTGLAAIGQFSELVTQVPLAEDGDGTELIARILEAESLEDLAEDDGLPSSKDLAPFTCRVLSIARRQSDNPSMTGFYLIVDGVNTANGEVLRFSAGGEQTVAVLAKLHQLGALPCEVTFTEAQTKGGRTAINARPIPGTNRQARTA